MGATCAGRRWHAPTPTALRARRSTTRDVCAPGSRCRRWVVGRSALPGRHSLAGHPFRPGPRATSAFSSPRAWVFTLLGIDGYLRALGGDIVVQAARGALAERLFGVYERSSSSDCPWFEER